MSKKILIIQGIITTIVIALFVAYFNAQHSAPLVPVIQNSMPLSLNVSDEYSPYINPTVLADLGKHYIINFKPLRDTLAELQKSVKDKTYIYFLYLNNSSWIGLNEKDLFPAASTIKVPLAMSVYRMKEQGKLELSDTYSLSDLDLDNNFGELYAVGPDKVFTVDELLDIMLRYSDNTAARALLHITESIGVTDPFLDVYNSMGWERVEFGNKPVYIDINLKTLSNMFISLYNASYINRVDSSSILGSLAKSPFDKQIVAGIPKAVPVAHKIGIDDVEESFSDCGIVYAPNRPYVLCIGYQGGSQVQANKFMKEVSAAVYDYVIKN